MDSMQPLSADPGERLLACYQQALGHDLPNRLVALQGLATILAEELAGREDRETREGVERLAGMARQIHEQVRALAEVGRAYRRPELSRELDLVELWEEVAAELRWQSNERCLHFSSKPGLPRPTAPREAVRRVLLEVARDALRRCPPDRPVSIELTGRTNERCVIIQDDATPPARPELLFEPRTDSPPGPSAGLGLFLARLLAEGWGGTLNVVPGLANHSLRLSWPGSANQTGV